MSIRDGCSTDFGRKVLATILAAVLPSPHEAANELIRQFNTFQHVARADYQLLAKIIGEDGAKLIRAIPEAVILMTRETAKNAASYILTLEASKVHIGAMLNGRRNEAFVVLYLNVKHRLVDEDLWEGSVDKASVYPREIMRRAILLDASTVILAHNHPSGDTMPSYPDLKITARLQDALDMIDVVLLDHLIFGEGEPYSMRENGDI